MSRTAPVRIAPPPAEWSAKHARSTRTGAVRPRSTPRGRDRATPAMVLGIVSLVFNPLLLPSIIGIVYGAGSLRAQTRQRGRAIAGIVCGAIGAVTVLVGAALLVVLWVLLPGIAAQGVAQTIETHSARTGTAITDVTCPTNRRLTTGSVVLCSGTTAAGPVSIEARIGDGDVTYRTTPAS